MDILSISYRHRFWLVVVVFLSLTDWTFAKRHPPCDSKIYCHGKLLHTVQMSRINDDDKTFVDQPLKFSPFEVLQNFSHFMESHEYNPVKSEIRQFVNENFHPNGHELLPWSPTDWHKNPKFLVNIVDKDLRRWANTLHEFWKKLGRIIRKDAQRKPERYSIIYVSHPFIIPGGRFREFYYWDSYWIQLGLLRSEMYSTVKGMIENFLEMVNFIGYVPNGGRIYYGRTQPPLLIYMMKRYFDATGDIEFLTSSLPILEKEFQFWIKHRMISVRLDNGRKYRLARYSSDKTGPRPESYSTDYMLGLSMKTAQDKDDLYTNIQSAAESGWDFSSRWFIPEENNEKGNRSNTKTRSILPVDLNSILFLNAKILSQYFQLVGDKKKSYLYSKIQNEFQKSIQDVFWDEELGSYFDYDLINLKRIQDFYPSSIVPLWTGVKTSPRILSRMLNYLESINIFDFPGGIPTSLYNTGEQWDFPNGWPPLIHIVIEALAATDNEIAQNYALQLTNKWIRSNYKAFYDAKPNTMFEKYDVTKFGSPGSGGEYTVVVGFGWTNGVVLDLLAQYGNILNNSKNSITEFEFETC